VTVDVTKVGALPSSMRGALATVQPRLGADDEGGNDGHRDAGTNAVAWNTYGYVPRKVIIGGRP
jgi:hypothetical protein